MRSVIGIIVFLAACATAIAQEYPNHPIKDFAPIARTCMSALMLSVPVSLSFA